jgi:Phage-related baseplate assembly protein
MVMDNLQAYISEKHRIGRRISRSAIISALHAVGVQRVELQEPADDIYISEKHRIGRRISRSYISEKHRIGRRISRSAIISALHAVGVQRVELQEPADDIIISREQASYCSNYKIEVAGYGE